ncbi:hypothetical protein [Halosimplex salinum]|uniref:hypothetical protein n=1 Tax=Halosimplex salinum TaxID=1710538 RepID=UPI000F467D3D|nr:hypothetical protein [Halosimplex salinum]
MAKSPGKAGPTWLDVADELIDESVDREESVTLNAEDLTVDVPLSFGEEAQRAQWQFDGKVTVTVEGMRGSIAEWMHLFREAQRE